eukprot:COSAG06_NODE_50272_length_320_cov_0.384615_1_plen_83_part_01
MNSSVEMMASGWKHFTTPRWVAEPLDKPELYTYTLRRRRVRVAHECQSESTEPLDASSSFAVRLPSRMVACDRSRHKTRYPVC